MKKPPLSLPLKKRIGVLGGGQLARMLVIEGMKLGLEMHVLSAQANDPAAQVTRFWSQGDIKDPYTLTAFFKAVDLVTLESEFLDESALLTAEAQSKTEIYPRPRLIAELSDRLKQKAWLERFNIPTAEFIGPRSASDIENFFSQHRQKIVLKRRRFGYDGYGTFIILNRKTMNSWLLEHSVTAQEFIAEKYWPFQRELAFQIVVNARGESFCFPLVEWQAQNSQCHWVKGPVRVKRSADLKRLQKNLVQGLRESGYVGLMAVELFETRKGLVVNEIAPRVHNSGHYTLNAFPINQFNAHLLALLGQSFSEKVIANLFSQAPGFAMLNLLGTSDTTPQIHLSPECYFHWYGKDANRRFRKMGHVTALGRSGDRALKQLLKLRKDFKV